MIPQIANKLIDLYTKPDQKILDPFCGSGTTLVEARLLKRNAIGNDINPFAVLLAKVKFTPIDFKNNDFKILNFLNSLENSLNKAKKEKTLPEPPIDYVPNILHWFNKYVSKDLEFIYEKINEIEDKDIRDFMLICFSKTIFDTSNIDHRSSRFIRILHENELSKFKPNVIKEFKKNVFDSEKRMMDFVSILKEKNIKNLKILVKKEDSRKLGYFDSEFDAVITSPPYGEEKNTISYTRWSKLSTAWLRLNHSSLNKSEKDALGSNSENNIIKNLEKLPSPTAVKLLKDVLKNDVNRVKDALPFFFDYYKTFKEIFRVINNDSPYCIVIGNRSIRKKLLDMEKVTVELASAVGFKHEKTYFRNIPTKMIPWDTPTGKTISRESIIILRK